MSLKSLLKISSVFGKLFWKLLAKILQNSPYWFWILKKINIFNTGNVTINNKKQRTTLQKKLRILQQKVIIPRVPTLLL